ncbi:alanine--tRNA ligase [Shouchella clausii]|uniref:Alanine--tRNA ligase n=3 Tax=Bacillaceae TaxID=186817 RepID=SYA_SHOC1|nr:MULTISPECIES: alanine--tRNA ligase [Shouchella]Q5WHM8.1 RecName: Full=Alanine--tRNA ligase; AltName: Full=Alanyl-tRNA synthetase; Short=AlaRS [Shouchella clausii KSM-K16]ALA51252.1 Alanyl-tRNA synthetase [Shouchella clausii]MBU3232669.1 alanine--tRNA ligase [Shouchella clausii]MBU3265566.1 alanine--tRNA ligase [Shouchella clausii]MBU3508605.1 alanine--tRNA ligase [Shouchella clausii]MBU3535230.1 alanine--tRNA ligase [Shouchella clausii]
MQRLSSASVRQMFIDFFKEKGHSVEPSASLVPFEDPSLLWINSGVATLKKYFDGRVIPENPRIVNAQKSIRTNDIENVGKTARHHTFFEMLGNFSIGDYFKEQAIEWAWEFLTDKKWIGFPQERLSVTVHPEDEEAYRYWHQHIGLPEERIIRLEGNFWDIGEGPSGPNSEIFYDRGPEYGDDPNDPELYPGGENERYLEIWNLVFSQFNHNADGTYTPLPKKNIDTGMGLERMVSVIQDTPTNFETDLFMPIIEATEALASTTYKEADTAFKVIADHIRTVAFAVGDGALPSNEGRGYVLRRLLRRAVRFAKSIGIDRPFMYELVPVVGAIMKDFYPEVADKQDFIARVIRTEEERFHETLNEGLAILSDIIEKAKATNKETIAGEDAFRLYDTYGFPIDLTEEYVHDEGLTVDRAGFDQEMEQQRQRARAARQESASMSVQEDVFGEVKTPSVFVGYEHTETDAVITTLVRGKEKVEQAVQGDVIQFFLDETPFYAESGGQVADRGMIVTDTGQAVVKDVKKAPNGQHLHTAEVTIGEISTGQQASARIEVRERLDIVKNHTATHLLHQALKDVLGEHVNQAGSLVSSERLRFDFSHFGQVTPNELQQIEEIVNEKVWQALPVDISIQRLEEAKAAGAMALFGEKYGSEVRVVRVGDYSLELCGGCHVRNTAEIGLFKITSESGIGAGVRRIEAVTSKGAYQFLSEQTAILKDAAERLKAKRLSDVPQRIESLQEELRKAQRENESLTAKLGQAEAGNLNDQVKEIGGVAVIAAQVDAKDTEALRSMVDTLKQAHEKAVIVLAAKTGNKLAFVAGVTKPAIAEGFHAGKLIKEVAARTGGGGGGRPDMAQAGGKDPAKLDEALAYVHEYVKSIS